jgi:hypothetical protein
MTTSYDRLDFNMTREDFRRFCVLYFDNHDSKWHTTPLLTDLLGILLHVPTSSVNAVQERHNLRFSTRFDSHYGARRKHQYHSGLTPSTAK